MSDSKGWGNPATASFAKRSIRLVAVDEFRVKVHKDIQPVIEHVLRLLSESDLKVTEVTGWPLSKAGTGLQILIDGQGGEAFAAAMGKYGFKPTRKNPNLYEWAGTYEEAVTAGDALDEAADTEEHELATTPDEPEAVFHPVTDDDPEWFTGKPGERVLDPADDRSLGRDVLFLQAYLGAPRTGWFDVDTISAVTDFQRRRDLKPDGIVGVETWRGFIPRIRPRLRPGDAGRSVRAISAGFIAAGVADRDSTVYGRYGVLMSRTVRHAQGELDLRVDGRIGALEWEALFAYPWTA